MAVMNGDLRTFYAMTLQCRSRFILSVLRLLVSFVCRSLLVALTGHVAAARWTRIVPPVIDTLLLLSGIKPIVKRNILPFTESAC